MKARHIAFADSMQKRGRSTCEIADRKQGTQFPNQRPQPPKLQHMALRRAPYVLQRREASDREFGIPHDMFSTAKAERMKFFDMTGGISSVTWKNMCKHLIIVLKATNRLLRNQRMPSEEWFG